MGLSRLQENRSLMGLTTGANIGSGGVDQGIDSFNRQYQQDAETNRNTQNNILTLENQRNIASANFGAALGTYQDALKTAMEKGDVDAQARAKQGISDLQEQYRTRMANYDQTRGSIEGGIIGGNYQVISTPVVDTRDKVDADGNPVVDDNGQPVKETYTKNVQMLRKTFGNGVQDTANAATVNQFLNLPENVGKDASQVYNNSVLKQAYTPITYNPNKTTTGAFTPEIAKGGGWEVRGLPNGGQKVFPTEKIVVTPPKYATDEAMLKAQQEEALRKAGLSLEDSDKSKAELDARYNYGKAQQASIEANNAQGAMDPMFMAQRGMRQVQTANGEFVNNPYYRKRADFIPELGGQGIITSRRFNDPNMVAPTSSNFEIYQSQLLAPTKGTYDSAGNYVPSQAELYYNSAKEATKIANEEYKKAEGDYQQADYYNYVMSNNPSIAKVSNRILGLPTSLDLKPLEDARKQAMIKLKSTYNPANMPPGAIDPKLDPAEKQAIMDRWNKAYATLQKSDSTAGGTLPQQGKTANGVNTLDAGQSAPEAVPMPRYVSPRQAEINTENQYNDTRSKMLSSMEKQMVDKYVAEKLKGMDAKDKQKDPNYIPQQIDPSTGAVIAPESYKLPKGVDYKAMAEQQLQEALKGDKKKMTPELQALKKLEEQYDDIQESYRKKAVRADINNFYNPSKYKNYSMY